MFPNDAIPVIKNPYVRASTSMTNRSPHFQTPHIDIKQKVIQGDPLLPLIFNLCLDPLLKWLETGNRGYNTHIQPNDRERYISSLAYAGDMSITSSTRRNATPTQQAQHILQMDGTPRSRTTI